MDKNIEEQNRLKRRQESGPSDTLDPSPDYMESLRKAMETKYVNPRTLFESGAHYDAIEYRTVIRGGGQSSDSSHPYPYHIGDPKKTRAGRFLLSDDFKKNYPHEVNIMEQYDMRLPGEILGNMLTNDLIHLDPSIREQDFQTMFREFLEVPSLVRSTLHRYNSDLWNLRARKDFIDKYILKSIHERVIGRSNAASVVPMTRKPSNLYGTKENYTRKQQELFHLLNSNGIPTGVLRLRLLAYMDYTSDIIEHYYPSGAKRARVSESPGFAFSADTTGISVDDFKRWIHENQDIMKTRVHRESYVKEFVNEMSHTVQAYHEGVAVPFLSVEHPEDMTAGLRGPHGGLYGLDRTRVPPCVIRVQFVLYESNQGDRSYKEFVQLVFGCSVTEYMVSLNDYIYHQFAIVPEGSEEQRLKVKVQEAFDKYMKCLQSAAVSQKVQQEEREKRRVGKTRLWKRSTESILTGQQKTSGWWSIFLTKSAGSSALLMSWLFLKSSLSYSEKIAVWVGQSLYKQLPPIFGSECAFRAEEIEDFERLRKSQQLEKNLVFKTVYKELWKLLKRFQMMNAVTGMSHCSLHPGHILVSAKSLRPNTSPTMYLTDFSTVNAPMNENYYFALQQYYTDEWKLFFQGRVDPTRVYFKQYALSQYGKGMLGVHAEVVRYRLDYWLFGLLSQHISLTELRAIERENYEYNRDLVFPGYSVELPIALKQVEDLLIADTMRRLIGLLLVGTRFWPTGVALALNYFLLGEPTAFAIPGSIVQLGAFIKWFPEILDYKVQERTTLFPSVTEEMIDREKKEVQYFASLGHDSSASLEVQQSEPDLDFVLGELDQS